METVVGEQSGKSSFPWASEGRKEGASVRRCLAEARWGAGVGSGANTGVRRGRALVNRWQEGERSAHPPRMLFRQCENHQCGVRKMTKCVGHVGIFRKKFLLPTIRSITPCDDSSTRGRGEEIAGKVSIRRKFLPFFDNQGEIELGNLIRSSTLSVLSKTLSASTEDGVGSIWYVFFYSEKLVTRRIWKNE